MTSKDMYSMGWEHALDDMQFLNSYKLMITIEIIKKKTIDVNKNVEYWNGYRDCLEEFDYQGIFV